MTYKVKLSNKALEDIDRTIVFLLKHWTEKEAVTYLNKLEDLKNIISSDPTIFASYDKANNIHKAVLTKHNIVYYKIDNLDKLVIIITIFNVYQDPEKLKL